jgi:hypothetical protein
MNAYCPLVPRAASSDNFLEEEQACNKINKQQPAANGDQYNV